MIHEPSRSRFTRYRQLLRQARRGGKPLDDDRGGPLEAPCRASRPRSFFQLFAAFWRMLDGYHAAVLFALATGTMATLLSLVPPAATKLTIDYVLAGKPPSGIWARLLPHFDNRLHLLWFLAGSVMLISIAETAIRLWGRWFATRTVTRVQVASRRRAFEHAVRLPLYRVQQLKSGGVASILRDDAGSIRRADLQHALQSLAGHRAVVRQPDDLVVRRLAAAGRLADSAAGDLPDASHLDRADSPAVSRHSHPAAGHRSTATEAFAGMRVVRAFGRQRSETGRFTRSNHYMARAGAARLVVGANRGSRVGDANPAGVGRFAAATAARRCSAAKCRWAT